MFGELVGAWAGAGLGRPGPARPLRARRARPGPRHADARRAARRRPAMPGFRAAARLWLVETSPALRRAPGRDARRRPRRAGRRPVDGAARPGRSSSSPTSSSTPCRSASSSAPTRSGASAWSALDGERLAFRWGPPRPDAAPRRAASRGLPDGAIAEVAPRRPRRSPPASAPASPRDGGAALLVDYGAWDGHGDTLQAVRGHAPADPLDAPGDRRPHRPRPLRAPSPRPRGRRARTDRVGQGAFLERARHHRARPGAGARPRRPRRVDAIVAAHRRLTHPDEMGNLFQVLALAARRPRRPRRDLADDARDPDLATCSPARATASSPAAAAPPRASTPG